ncbi:MAG: dockerin type I domain-containing protein [Chthoniobacterales bacterium]
MKSHLFPLVKPFARHLPPFRHRAAARGLCLLAALAIIGATTAAKAQTFTNSTSIAVPNPGFAQGPASPYPSGINVSGTGTQLVSISVTLSNFSHFYPADVDVLLVGPQGQNVMLMSDVGTFFPVSGLNFIFTDTASTSMPSAAMLTSGTFAPTNFDPVGDVDGFAAPAPLVGPYGSSFSPFLGTNPNGTWSLYIVDDVAGNAGQFAGGWSMTITTNGAPALQLTNAVSRKVHGGAGTFDVPLPLTSPAGVECRSGSAGHTLVFAFTNNVVSGNASVTSGTGSIAGSPTFSGNTMTVNLTGVTDVQTLTVLLSGVTDSLAQVLPNTSVSASFLLGDTTGNGSVNASDVGQIKGQSGVPVSNANFRTDINANGVINSSDVGQGKAASGDALPPAAPFHQK